MGFYGPEPFDTATAVYYEIGPEETGVFYVEVQGEAPNYTSGINLVRDEHFVGGLKVHVMGWTGPLGEGTAPYKVHASFPGRYVPEIIVAGSNQRIPVEVEVIPAEATEEHLARRLEAG